MISGFGLPTESMADLLSTKDIGRSLSPMVKMPIELTTGQNLFTGKPILEERYGGRYSKMPQFVKDMIGYKESERTSKTGKKYTKTTVDPYMAYLMANLPVSGPVSTQYKRVAEVGESPWNILNLVSGGRVYKRNVAQEQSQREREAQKILEEYLLRKGIGETYTGFYIPQEIRRELLARY